MASEVSPSGSDGISSPSEIPTAPSSCEPETPKGLPDLFDQIYLDTTPQVDESICKLISDRIKTKETSLLKVVEELGPRLTSTHVQERSKAVEILAHVFTNLPPDFLNKTEVTFLIDFLCDRCKDQHMVMPKIIMCALPIVKCKNLPDGAGAKLLNILFREANVQSHIHRIRNIFFKTVQVLLGSRLQELKSETPDFIMHFLQSMDGEKDPRNLLLLFRIIPRVIANFPLEPFTEDFFEILGCYFPIDFNPSVSIPGEEPITRKDLANALHLCLSQTNEFAEMLLPIVLEKLESNLIDAKLDSLELLKMCCDRSYVAQDVEPYLGQVWYQLRREIFMGGNDSVEPKCYEFLKSAFKMISKDEKIFNQCLTMIYTECKHHLSEPELRLIMPTKNILQCITDSGQVACSSVVRNMFPVLYEQICAKVVRSEKKRLLGIWEALLDTCRLHKYQVDLESLEKWDEIRGLWFTLLSNEDWEMVTLTLRIFSSCIALSSGFSGEHRKLLQEHLTRLIGDSGAMPKETKSAIILISRTLCHFHGDQFSSDSCPVLLSTLSHAGVDGVAPLCTQECPEGVFCVPRAFSGDILGETAHLHESSFEKCVQFLLTLLEKNNNDLEAQRCLRNIIQGACSPESDQDKLVANSNSVSYPKPDLSAILLKLEVRERTLSCAFHVCTGSPPAVHWKSLENLTSITRSVIRHADEAEQGRCADQYWNSKIGGIGDIQKILLSIPGVLVESILGPVRPTVNISLKKELVLYILEKIVLPDVSDGDETLQEFNLLPCIRLIASILNKVEEEELDSYLMEVEPLLQKQFPESPQTEEVTINSNSSLIQALIWIVKALAMRGFQKLEHWMDKIIKLLHNPVVGGEVVKYFHILVSDDPLTLNPSSFCRFKFLYIQRIFLMAVDKLVTGYRGAPSPLIQFNFIRALSSQLRHVPSEVLFMKIDSVLPLLVASLKCNTSSQVLLSSLNALTEMMESPDTKHKITEYCHDLVPQLTRLSQYKESMEVRIVSLRCLRKCSRAPSHLIMPLRSEVVDNLQLCLDDGKRLVRKEAVLTRNIWILIGAPGGIP